MEPIFVYGKHKIYRFTGKKSLDTIGGITVECGLCRATGSTPNTNVCLGWGLGNGLGFVKQLPKGHFFVSVALDFTISYFSFSVAGKSHKQVPC